MSPDPTPILDDALARSAIRTGRLEVEATAASAFYRRIGEVLPPYGKLQDELRAAARRMHRRNPRWRVWALVLHRETGTVTVTLEAE